jgi:NAD(P)-dependent dehydrogenase (short-subunit alcohol dehydrogenase family)
MSEALEKLFAVKDKRIVITGGGGILCGEMARSLAALGARVAVLDLSEAAAKAVADDIRKKGGRAIAVKANVLDKPSLEAARDEVLRKFGGVDALINGAGGNKKEATTSDTLPFFDLPADAIRFVFELNVIGTVLPSQVFGKLLTQAGAGAIVNTS